MSVTTGVNIARIISAICSPRLSVLLVLPLMLLVSACASTGAGSPDVMTDFDKSYDFSAVRKIAVQPINRTVIATVNVSDIQESRINEAVSTELQRRGFQMVSDNAAADMFLSWHLVTKEKTDVQTVNGGGSYSCWNCAAATSGSARQLTRGTFIVDMIDPLQLRSVWRATFESRMRGDPNSEQGAENRRVAAQAIFREFPPGAGGS